jgi:hypothetical protein
MLPSIGHLQALSQGCTKKVVVLFLLEWTVYRLTVERAIKKQKRGAMAEARSEKDKRGVEQLHETGMDFPGRYRKRSKVLTTDSVVCRIAW